MNSGRTHEPFLIINLITMEKKEFKQVRKKFELFEAWLLTGSKQHFPAILIPSETTNYEATGYTRHTHTGHFYMAACSEYGWSPPDPPFTSTTDLKVDGGVLHRDLQTAVFSKPTTHYYSKCVL